MCLWGIPDETTQRHLYILAAIAELNKPDVSARTDSETFAGFAERSSAGSRLTATGRPLVPSAVWSIRAKRMARVRANATVVLAPAVRPMSAGRKSRAADRAVAARPPGPATAVAAAGSRSIAQPQR